MAYIIFENQAWFRYDLPRIVALEMNRFRLIKPIIPQGVTFVCNKSARVNIETADDTQSHT